MISDYPVFYITPDPLRAVGLSGIFDNFRVVCYDDKPLVDQLSSSGIKTYSLEREIGKSPEFMRNAGKMLENPKVREFIEVESKGKNPAILFFKPSYKLDLICKKHGYIKLGNDADLNREFEDKIGFFRMCQQMGWPTPPGVTGKMADFDFDTLKDKIGPSFVIQFGRGWAGSTTFFIDSESDWRQLLQKWPEKDVKISRKINGITVLNNACVFKGSVLISNPAIQLPPINNMTGNATATYGRQWPSGLSEEKIGIINELTHKIGMRMGESGYKGWFGLDFLVDKESNEIFISENNARLTASATFFTQTELKKGREKPMFYYHAIQFLKDVKEPEWHVTDIEASQFVYRNFKKRTLTVTKSVKSGIYDLYLVFRRDGSGITDLKTRDEIFLYCPREQEKINPDIEIFTVEYKGRILNSENNYEKWFTELVSKIYETFEFK